MKPLPIPPALRDALAQHERMKALVANPVMDAVAKQWRDEREHMAALAGSAHALPLPPPRPASLPPVLNITVNMILDGVESEADGGAV
jgi:hypothetical protein